MVVPKMQKHAYLCKNTCANVLHVATVTRARVQLTGVPHCGNRACACFVHIWTKSNPHLPGSELAQACIFV